MPTNVLYISFTYLFAIKLFVPLMSERIGPTVKKDADIYPFKSKKNFKYVFYKKHTQQQKFKTHGQWIKFMISILEVEVVTAVVFE